MLKISYDGLYSSGGGQKQNGYRKFGVKVHMQTVINASD